MGKIASIAEACVIVEDFFLGPIFDAFGRKVPMIIGFLVLAAAIGAIPLFKSLYPAYCILRCLISLGMVIGMNVPLLPDYVHKNSLGLANGYLELVTTAAYIFSSTGLLQIGRKVDSAGQKWIYYGLAAFIGLVALFLIFGIKDVIATKEANAQEEVGDKNLTSMG